MSRNGRTIAEDMAKDSYELEMIKQMELLNENLYRIIHVLENMEYNTRR